MPVNRQTPPIRRILITGASGELGGALARHYAAQGMTLLLWGRDRARLDAIADVCRNAGAQAIVRSIDLADGAAAIAAIEADYAAGDAPEAGIDLALLVAGLGEIRAPTALVEDPGQILRQAIVNFATPSAMAAVLGQRMAARGHGGIVLIGSAAAFHALPFATSYAASKAGLARFADALRIGVARHGVRVTLVSPGFIDTAAANRTPGPKPLMIAPPRIAACIARAAEQGRAHLVIPWPFAALRVIDRLLPRPLRDRLLLSLTPKPRA